MAEPCAKVEQPQAYRKYYSEPRPDAKLPPLNYSQDGHIHLVPGEAYCRWRHPVTGVLCNKVAGYGSLELRDHYRLDHGCKVAPDDHPLFDGMSDKGYRQTMRWYTDMLHGRMPSWPPAPGEQDRHSTSSDSIQPKGEPLIQASSEIQARPIDGLEGNQFSKVPEIRQAGSSGEEKQPLDLKIGDLPLGTQEEFDRHSAVRLCTLFKQHQASMPFHVRSKLLHLLTSGQFQHNEQSMFHPLKHQLSIHMYDKDAGEIKWIGVTYERWFVLAGIYGWAMLKEHADGICKAVLMRYGEHLDRNLTFKNSSDNIGSLVRPFLSQLGDEISVLGPMTRQHEYMIQQHEQTISTQAATIKQLQAMNSNQQIQIDKLNAIVGVQSLVGSHEQNDNNIDNNHEASQDLEILHEGSFNSKNVSRRPTIFRKRIRRG